MKNLTFVMVVLTLMIAFFTIMPVHGESEIYDSVLRLHVLANSDSEEDQALKLKVRDALLSRGEEIFLNCNSREEAVEAITEYKNELEAVAREVIYTEG